MKKIPLTQGKMALVDNEDFDQISGFKYFAIRSGKNWYAKRYMDFKYIPMANDILSTPRGYLNHHKNKNGLDNRRFNLETVNNKKHREYHSEDIRRGVKLSKKPRWNAYKEFKKWAGK